MELRPRKIGRRGEDNSQQIVDGNISFNVFDTLQERIYGRITSDSSIYQYVAGCGGKVIRVMFPVLLYPEYNSVVFANGVPDRDFVDSDFRPLFLSSVDAMFDEAWQYGLKVHASIVWHQEQTALLCGETLETGYTSTDTNTSKFVIRMAKWLASSRIHDRALYSISIGNEWLFDMPGYPTSAQLAVLFESVSFFVKKENPNVRVTSDLMLPPRAYYPNGLDPWIDVFTSMFNGMDDWCFHFYIDYPMVGRGTYLGYGQGGPSLGPLWWNAYGFENLDTVIAALSRAARRAGKGFIVGEIGVGVSQEDDAYTVKKTRALAACSALADYAMIWNAQPAARAGSNQLEWYVAPDTTRGGTYYSLATSFNKGRSTGFGVIPTVSPRSGRYPYHPQWCFKFKNDPNSKITYTIPSEIAVDTYSILLWMRIDGALTSYQPLIEFGDANTGFSFLGSQSAGEGFYATFKKSGAGTVANTAGQLPSIIPIGEWHHYALIINKTIGYLEIYYDGILRDVKVLNGDVGILQAGSFAYFGSNSSNNGAPISIQDFCIKKHATKSDVLSHMTGTINGHLTRFLAIEGGYDLSSGAVSIGDKVTIAHSA